MRYILNTIQLQKPTIKNAKDIYNLVKKCPPLDLNSLYAYALIGKYFYPTSCVAYKNDEIVGFVSGFMSDEKKLFIWQVAVSPDARGEGVAKKMLTFILQNNPLVKMVETTINPSNKASFALFDSVAKKSGGGLAGEELFMSKEEFVEAHEDEIRYIFTIKNKENL